MILSMPEMRKVYFNHLAWGLEIVLVESIFLLMTLDFSNLIADLILASHMLRCD